MSALARITRAAAIAAALVPLLYAPSAAQAPGARSAPGDREKPLPLEAARKAKFTASEGTWMSVDVSPDGRTLAFDLLGDLYTMPVTGGRATKLVGGMAFQTQPRFSPDGRRIAYVSDQSGGDNVWTIALDLTDTTQVTQGNGNLYTSPAWTPDGKYIVVSRSGGLGGPAKLQMIRLERPGMLPLVPQASAGLKMVGAAVSPDGRYVWYAGRAGDWQYNAVFPQYQLYRYDRERDQTVLMTSRYGSGFRPALSPDGRWLVYGSRERAETGLRRRDLRTGEETWLAYPVQRDEMESRATLDVLPGYAFTPASDAVIVSYGGRIWRVPVDGTAASEIPFEAEVELAVGPEVKFAYAVDTAAAVTARQIRSPVASPDGRRIAFTAFDRVWIRDMPDGTPRRVSQADVGEFHPRWSPDGRSLAWVTWDDRQGGHIMRASADGNAAPVQLTSTPALYYNPAWNPDGTRIVATRGAARELKEASGLFFGPLGGEFIWVSASGGAPQSIAPTGGRDVAHFRTDEPHRIYAYNPGEGLVSFRWDGTDVKRHLMVRGAPAAGGIADVHPQEFEFLPGRVFPVRTVDILGTTDPLEQGAAPPPAGLVMISPDGSRALAQVGMDIYAMEIPAAGGAVPTVSVASPQGAPVTVRKLTDVGGEFASWSADGDRILFGLGNVLFTYDLAHVQTTEDSLKAAAHGRALLRVRARFVVDSLRLARARADSLGKAGTPLPDSLETRITRLAADSVQAAADSLIAKADSILAAAAAIAARADSVRAGNDAVLADTAATYRPRETTIEVTLPRDVPRGSVVLRGGRVLTMKGHEILENADVVITDDRIVGVGARGEVPVPEGAQVIDVAGRTVIPGFVDTHYHAQWLIPEVHPAQTWQYLTNLAFGVTTTRDPQTGTTDVLSYQDRVETGGMIGPRIYSTGPGVFLDESIRDQEHAKTVLRRYARYYDTKTLKMYMAGNRQQRQWIINAAKELELMPTTEGGLDFKLELTHAIDGYPGIEHSLPVAPIYQDVVELFKASQTTNSPTLLVSYGGPFGENWFYTTENVHDDAKLRRFAPEENIDARARRRGPGAGGSPGQAGWFLEEEYVFGRHAQFVKRLVEDSARAAVGSHGQLQGLGYHWELWAMGSGGASNHDVLRMATIFGAEAIGFGGDLGTIEAGKLADILVLERDPLADLRNTAALRYVMKNGRLYEAETLDEVWPRQRPLPAQVWQNAAPAALRAGIR